MNIEKELTEMLGASALKLTSHQLMQVVDLLEEAQYRAYADGYDDGFKDAEDNTPNILRGVS